MDFKVRKISTIETRIKNRYWRRMVRFFGPKVAIAIILIVGLSGVFWLGSLVLDSDFFLIQKTREFLSFGPLKEDKYGHTNILLLGVGGDGAEGGHLSDSIMIASIDPANPSISFLSLPRDLFISSRIGDRKVNEIYAAARYKYGDQKGLEIAKDAVADFTGVDIHYGAVIDFRVFLETIDTLGGIDIFVPETIEDPFYPDDNYGYKTFVVRKGFQHFDGATALEYARSRKTSSDYSRAHRQQDLILAIRKRAEDLNFLTDFEKLQQFFEIYRRNVNTDIGITELVALAKIGIAIDYSNSINGVLNNDALQMGGFLYTPAKEFYGGQFVLLPEDLKETQHFMDIILIHPEILLENAQISVLNGSMIEGRAGQISSRLRRFGFHVIEVGNYESDKPLFRTVLKDLSGGTKAATKKFLEEIFDTPTAQLVAPEEISPDNLIDFQLLLGTN
ncbi:LCP family protein [Candidatus Gracilibacteria bacterium]|nr:LCP family protein [Candidatus Gracilibacteria bacterium]